MITRILLIALMLLAPLSIEAATYHVKKTGNDSNVGSDASPWQTIQKGVTAAVAGDTVLVHTGVYTETVTCNNSGTSSNPIIIQANGSVGNFDAVKVNYSATLQAFIINSKSWITIRGFELDGSLATASGGNFVIRIEPNSSNITIEYNNIHGGGQNIMGAHIGTHPGAIGSNNITIQYNQIHDNRALPGLGSGNHNIYTDTGSNWLIQGNTIYNATGYNIQMYPETKNSIIRKNSLSYAALDDQGNGSAGIIASDTGHLIEQNLIFGTGSSSGMGIRLQYFNPSNITVRNNTVYNVGQYGIYIAAGATGMVMTNNLVVGASTPISNNAGGGATLTTNITNASAAAITTYTVSSANLHLKTGSPAVDSGTTIAAITSDYDGIIRPQGPAYDVGAYELNVTGDTTPPTAPSNLSIASLALKRINLSWTLSTDDTAVTNYYVEQCAGDSCSSFSQVGTTTGLTFSNTGLLVSASYSYRVRATDAVGNLSSYSATATATVPPVAYHPTLNLRRVNYKEGSHVDNITHSVIDLWRARTGGYGQSVLDGLYAAR